MKASDLLKYLPSPNVNATGHGLDLTKVYRSYKNSPHNVDALYLKYLVHRLENGKLYHSSLPETREGMDYDFLRHHQRGKAAEKNGHISVEDLKEFIHNPDTIKLAKQLVNHKQKLNNFILKEHPDHIVNINGEPHLRLTRGLSVNREQRGEEHALASYADQPDPPFGGENPTYHHQHVPLKNIWFTYDYGPKEASSEKYGPENEFVVSPHKIVYNENHEDEPTKQILVRDHHSLKATDFRFASFKDKITKDNIDNIVEKNPVDAARYLKDHPLLNKHHLDIIARASPVSVAAFLHGHRLLDESHIDTITQRAPRTTSQYLHNHPLFNQKHFDTIAENDPWSVTEYFKDHPFLKQHHIDNAIKKTTNAAAEAFQNHPLFNKQHIDYVVEHSPFMAVKFLKNNSLFDEQHIDALMKKLEPITISAFLKDHPLLKEHHIDTLIQKDPGTAHYLNGNPKFGLKHIQQLIESRPTYAIEYLKDHPLLNEQHIDTLVQKDPSNAAFFLGKHPLFNQKHIDYIVEKLPFDSASTLRQHPLLNENHIHSIINKYPIAAAVRLQNHPAFNQQHIDKIVEQAPYGAAEELHNHPLLNEQHIDKIVEKEPKAAATYLSDHPIYKAKYGNMQKSFKQLTKEYERLTKADAPVKINPEHGRMIADAYHNMKHDPNHPEVKAAYNALINETNEQYKNLLQQGYKFTRITDPNFRPYKNSKEMHADIENNKHLYYYPTSLGFGSEDSHPKDHPLLTPTEFVSHDGEQMVANDILRQVHDINGHYHGGKTTFSPTGEHQSYLHHKKMYSTMAQPALANELTMQNSWVNFGPHGEHNRKNPLQTIFAPQKSGLVPEWVWKGKWHGEA